MESYQEAWKTGSIDEVRRLAMWQANEDDVIELERLQRELEEVRERVVRRDFLASFKRQHPIYVAINHLANYLARHAVGNDMRDVVHTGIQSAL